MVSCLIWMSKSKFSSLGNERFFFGRVWIAIIWDVANMSAWKMPVEILDSSFFFRAESREKIKKQILWVLSQAMFGLFDNVTGRVLARNPH